jgi:group I intron endonuclease
MNEGQHSPSLNPEQLSGIYSIVCLANGKIYVGSAVHIERRWGEHRRMLSASRHYNSHLQCAWNKYGEPSFEFGILELAPRGHLIAREQFWIDRHDASNKKKGFNLCPNAASILGLKRSEETKAKLADGNRRRVFTPEMRANYSASQRNRITPEYRKELSVRAKAQQTPEMRTRLSEALKGRRLTPEHRAKIMASHPGMSPEHKAKLLAINTGRVKTPEELAKLSAANKGKIVTPETRAKLSKSRKAMDTPEYRAKVSAGIKASMTPERLASMSASRLKLSPDAIAEIRNDLAAGAKGCVLARKHGVSDSLISNIKLGKCLGYSSRLTT